MQLKVKSLNLLVGRPVAMIHESTANELSVYQGDRIRIKHHHSIAAVVNIATGILKENEIYLSKEVMRHIEARENSTVEVSVESPPHTTKFILDKLNKEELDYSKLYEIVGDMVHNKLTEAEIAYFVSGVYINGLTNKEAASLSKAMAKFGNIFEAKGNVYDKHSVGGIAGNRTTPLIIPICAAAGLKMPKTSSRAITSAAGTADVIETLAKVEFSIGELNQIIKKAGACMVWGGALGLAPADDKIIRVERLIRLDPEAQLISSILSKKLAVKSKGVLIDISYGKTAKKKTKLEADKLKSRFEKVAKLLRLNVKVITTDGSQPIGNGVGPILEARDILLVLSRSPNRPLDLERKSINLAGIILEMSGKSKPGKGKILAKKLLESGQAFEKFKEIITAQKGVVDLEKLTPGTSHCVIQARKSGKVKEISNRAIAAVCRAAGCPTDKGAGMYLKVHNGSKVKKGDTLFHLYAETPEKLNFARRSYARRQPILVG
ncbi:thymidine phosphorylase [Nanoarchaeota archaeon]